MVEPQFSKLMAGVRFPYPAQNEYRKHPLRVLSAFCEPERCFGLVPKPRGRTAATYERSELVS